MAADPWVDGLTIGEVLSRTARKFPLRDAMVFPQAGQRYTWQEVNDATSAVAKSLLAFGLKSGDHFGVWATNWPEWVLLQYASARIGVVLVCVNPSYRADELAFALAHSDLCGLALIQQFKDSHYDELLDKIWPDLKSAKTGALNSQRFPKLKTFVRIRGAAHPAMHSWDQFLKLGESVSDDELAAAIAVVRPEDKVNLQYTSGTTGNPKGALLTHRNLLLNAFYTGEGQKFSEKDRVCIPVPLYHCFGCVIGTLGTMVSGSAMVFPHESYLAAATLDAIEKERCTAIYGVPTMFIGMLEDPSYPGRDLTSLRTGVMAGSPCPIELMKRVTNEMGASQITIAYGQTEASPIVTMTRTDDPIEKRVGTVGRPIGGVEVKVIDSETGQTLPDETEGEICSRGHQVMLGYYSQPEATAAAIDTDGWLHSGDIGLRTSDGYFRITGRSKDMIIRGGENISPREIEELLYQHPAVEQVQVLGVPDARLGERILACVAVRDGQAMTEEEVKGYCMGKLAKFKTPEYVWFMDEFPTTVTGKIQKFRLREMAVEHFDLQDAASVETA